MDLRKVAQIASDQVYKKLVKNIDFIKSSQGMNAQEALKFVLPEYPFKSEISKILIKQGAGEQAKQYATLLIEEYRFPELMAETLVEEYLDLKESQAFELVAQVTAERIKPIGMTIHDMSSHKFKPVEKSNSVEIHNLKNVGDIFNADIICLKGYKGRVSYKKRIPEVYCEKKRSFGGA